MFSNMFYTLSRRVLCIAFFLSFSFISFAEESPQVDNKEESRTITLDSRTGYKKANLNWNISTSETPSGLISQIGYNNLDIVEAGVDMTAVIHQIYSRASISFGKIVDGDGVDSDYVQDNRIDLDTHSKSEIYKDISALCIGLGYQFDMNSKKNIKISPLAGVSYQAQNLRPKNGLQTLSKGMDLNPDVKVLTGMDSTYAIEWKSWFLGVDFIYEVFKNIYFSSSVEYHNAHYNAEADWNFTQNTVQPVSVVQEAVGTGSKINIGINRQFAERWLIGLLYDWQQWSTDSGDDILFWSEGDETKSNEVNWGSQSINLSIGFSF